MPRITEENGDSDSSDTDNTPLLRNRGRNYGAIGTSGTGDSDSSETEVKRPIGDDVEAGVTRPARDNNRDNTPLLRNRGRDYGAIGASGAGPVAVRPPAPVRGPPVHWRRRPSLFGNPSYLRLPDGRLIELGVNGSEYDQYPDSHRWRDDSDFANTLAGTIICLILIVIMISAALIHKSYTLS